MNAKGGITENDMAAALRSAGYVVMYPTGRDGEHRAADPSAVQSRAGNPGSYDGSRTSRAAKVSSNAGQRTVNGAGLRKGIRSAPKKSMDLDRFRHFASAPDVVVSPAPEQTIHRPQKVASSPVFASAAAAAAFALAAAGKVRGGR